MKKSTIRSFCGSDRLGLRYAVYAEILWSMLRKWFTFADGETPIKTIGL
ncbi:MULTISPECIES: hypothetical protein [Arthrospira]|nr:hypothetical protein [Arthrospira platensis]MBD2669352.1 hypothetical protein [Arthrospira platensis FACHB-439]MBD2709750.1 hypothetical protein [Arthrospira platensis FACHB-835]MDF2211751.1 hypothetical protein [Arthrospira platensis NCB002]MDT9182296.1 hypothetical protein [Limnospira sp. PMC 289.06]MDT9294429.1 hypothetical protein [Arthrospira platensis PCC 7345]MDT9310048.1 hypothetical protein [Limnospira sp. Paracas R14]QQW29618.1 hypothetical protein AP9108_01555 [Arthrospira sp. 